MNVIFHRSLRQRIWQGICRHIHNQTCPFCGVPISGKNFTGAAFIDGELRAFDKNFVCLLEFANREKDHENNSR